MCRFLLVKSKKLINPKDILSKFSDMAKKSRSPDGDWQGDGWGIAWLDENAGWQIRKSLKPIWEDIDVFSSISKTNLFLAHARSATFLTQKGILEFNEPFIDGEYAFVFNGFLKGVSLSNISGRIGSQKIWSILKEQLRNNIPQVALENTKQILLDNSKEIIALNIGLVTKTDIYSLNYFTQHPEYYFLKEQEKNGVHIVCSQDLG